MLRIVIQTILTVIALLITASVSLAAECTDDPNACTPKKLCEIATETYGSDGKTNWSAAASKVKHVTFAQGLGMTCGVIAVLDLCDSDPNECKISQLCDKATTNSAGQMNWDDNAEAYVALAKEYGLSCDVVSSSGQRQSNTSESDKLMNWILFQGDSKISYGDQAHPDMITLGPKRDERLDTSSYEGNRSIEIRMPLSTPVLAPLDLEFVGYINRSAKMRKSSSGKIKQPYDDLELCFKSINRKTQLVMCVYRARSSPLLPKLFKTKWCNVRPDWDSSERGVPKGGLIYYERNTTKYYDFKKDDVCGVKIGTIIKRGEILAYPGAQGDKTRIDFRFKVYDEKPNSLLDKKKTFNVNLHWVQPTVFFDWECFEEGQAYGSEVLTYPFDCKPLYELNSSEQSDFEEKKEDKSLNKKTYDLENYKKQFKTQSNLRRKQVQSALKKLGYYSSSIDGIWGKGTRAALMDYAAASNMEDESLSKVFSELLRKSGLKSGKSVGNSNVENVQNTLRLLGYYSSPIDGSWGEETRKALENFYLDKGKMFSGALGEDEVQLLDKELDLRGLKSFKYSLEQITGSKYHQPDGGVSVGTWWGYNQIKVARFKDIVFTYVVENDNELGTTSLMTLYKKKGEKNWEKGASIPCSVPGNILIDEKGGLHVLIHQPENALSPSLGSNGSLEYYYFQKAGMGDITSFKHETIIRGIKGKETVNKRIGATISDDDTIAFAFGLGDTEQLYFKKFENTKWTKMLAGKNLGHNFYYPFPLITPKGFTILAIQDDFVIIDGEANNPYHIAISFEMEANKWSHQYLLDNSQTLPALTYSEWMTVDTSDMYLDTHGSVHAILRDRISGKWLHYIKEQDDVTWSIDTIDTYGTKINWIKLLELENKIFYSMYSSRNVYLMDRNSQKMIKLQTQTDQREKNAMEGMYAYVASPSSGTSRDSNFVDIILLEGSRKAYPQASNYYLKISKKYILEEFQTEAKGGNND